jgi:hypothetical protein
MVLIFFSKKPLVRRPSKDATTRKQLDEKVGSTMKISFVSSVIRGIATARTEFCRLRPKYRWARQRFQNALAHESKRFLFKTRNAFFPKKNLLLVQR